MILRTPAHWMRRELCFTHPSTGVHFVVESAASRASRSRAAATEFSGAPREMPTTLSRFGGTRMSAGRSERVYILALETFFIWQLTRVVWHQVTGNGAFGVQGLNGGRPVCPDFEHKPGMAIAVVK